MRKMIDMAREAGMTGLESGGLFDNFLAFEELVRADEREQIAQMIEDAPTLLDFAQNEHGGCLMCGFTPKIAASAIRARSQHGNG